ncbi:hypothetical protein BC938DRAFT_480358 [Jimgerdemannia flammicorona]|uniref:S-adenosyl-L-methionine-dependent methyltransferase n=1 Tax=Jimgerdemannia flammicorona TaxID=994334 RepID=A0A433QIP0_9FUNG|nr:hypothetical protein BC938DRAFT_480358 [Jimgerdemannia flammicorona]
MSLVTSTSTSTSPPRPVPEITWVAGRAFQKGGNPAYMMPTDGEEPDRLDEQHNLLQRVYGSNHLSPLGAELERGCKVLDAGAGTGIWSMEMAGTYPRSEFYATDVVDLFPPEEDAPPNWKATSSPTIAVLAPKASLKNVHIHPSSLLSLHTRSARSTPGLLAQRPLPSHSTVHTFFSLRDINTSVVHSLDHMLCTAGLTTSTTSRRPVSVSLRQMERYYDSIKSQVWASLGVGEDEFDATAAASIVEMNEKPL